MSPFGRLVTPPKTLIKALACVCARAGVGVGMLLHSLIRVHKCHPTVHCTRVCSTHYDKHDPDPPLRHPLIITHAGMQESNWN